MKLPSFPMRDRLAQSQRRPRAERFQFDEFGAAVTFARTAEVEIVGVRVVGGLLDKEDVVDVIGQPTIRVGKTDFERIGGHIGVDKDVAITPLDMRAADIGVRPQCDSTIGQQAVGVGVGGKLGQDGRAAGLELGDGPRRQFDRPHAMVRQGVVNDDRGGLIRQPNSQRFLDTGLSFDRLDDFEAVVDLGDGQRLIIG